MKRSVITISSVLFVAAMIGSLAFANKEEIPAPEEPLVKWYTFEEAVKLSKKEPKKLFIDVYTDWCGWCKKMDANTFNNPTVAKYLNEKYYPVKFNAEQKESIVFMDYTFKYVPYGNRGYHELAAALLNNQLSYPTVVFMDEELMLIQPLPGYQLPNTFYPILEFFGDDHYKKISWDEFQKVYKSPF